MDACACHHVLHDLISNPPRFHDITQYSEEAGQACRLTCTQGRWPLDDMWAASPDGFAMYRYSAVLCIA